MKTITIAESTYDEAKQIMQEAAIRVTELKADRDKWKEIAGRLHWALTYIRTYASYPVADNAINEYEELIKTVENEDSK